MGWEGIPSPAPSRPPCFSPKKRKRLTNFASSVTFAPESLRPVLVAGRVWVPATGPSWPGAGRFLEIAPLNIPAHSPEELHAASLSILPRIQLHGHIYFR